ncbi:MAG: hypothetical protein Q9M97_02555 [Candidatus Gracilibacteria bacterium]|nr:hypothetical protein [Candidatus Gracilibacteria bacterium]
MSQIKNTKSKLANIIDNIKKNFFNNFLLKVGYGLILLSFLYTFKGLLPNILANTVFLVMGGLLLIGIIILLTFCKEYKNSILIIIIGIFVNYVIILSGGYSIGNNGDYINMITFVYLSINTIFAFSVALIYKTRVILLITFLIAFINPFIIGNELNGNYFINESFYLILYSLFIGFIGIYISFIKKDIILFFISLLAGNILFLVSPFSNVEIWSANLLITLILFIFSVYILLKKNIENKKSLYLYISF